MADLGLITHADRYVHSLDLSVTGGGGIGSSARITFALHPLHAAYKSLHGAAGSGCCEATFGFAMQGGWLVVAGRFALRNLTTVGSLFSPTFDRDGGIGGELVPEKLVRLAFVPDPQHDPTSIVHRPMTDLIEGYGYEQTKALAFLSLIERKGESIEATTLCRMADCSWKELFRLEEVGLLLPGVDRVEEGRAHPTLTERGREAATQALAQPWGFAETWHRERQGS